jgi:hypothetical protein
MGPDTAPPGRRIVHLNDARRGLAAYHPQPVWLPDMPRL